MTNKDYYMRCREYRKTLLKTILKELLEKKAGELHPDVNEAPDAEEKFKELGQAYEA
ncbi:MAG: DnaJ domain-containing protein [Anaerotruncus sp.]|nr:DnaJ domain-containing protein [Anaerotruncus sp.]